ncbi:MAG TPA: hypothetical protein GX708_05265 [Gallicola sp.]|nr:hypothetical protein [Gallicola sp.]
MNPDVKPPAPQNKSKLLLNPVFLTILSPIAFPNKTGTALPTCFNRDVLLP